MSDHIAPLINQALEFLAEHVDEKVATAARIYFKLNENTLRATI
jgi:hypothetical protein